MAHISKSFPLRNICVSLDREIIVHMIVCVLCVIQVLWLCTEYIVSRAVGGPILSEMWKYAPPPS